MTVRVRVISKALQNRLKSIGKNAPGEVRKALEAGGQLVASTAKRKIQSGPKTGVVYTRGNVSHQASAPGEPPATDTGGLVSSISYWIADAGNQVLVGTRSVIGKWLEFGTRHMAARPWLFPSLEENRQKIRGLLQAAWKRGLTK